MNTLDKFKSIRSEKEKEEKEQENRNKERNRTHQENEDKLFNLLKKNIMPFDGETIDQHKLNVKVKGENRLDLLIDGKPYLEFTSYTKVLYCNCSECADGGYGHPADYEPDILVLTYNEKDKSKFYFGCYDYSNEDHFAACMVKVLEEYEV